MQRRPRPAHQKTARNATHKKHRSKPTQCNPIRPCNKRMQMGANMRYIDVGGGLAVDYDGSFTDTPASMSYTVLNYANDVSD